MFVPVSTRTRKRLAAAAGTLGLPPAVLAAAIIHTALDIGLLERLLEALPAKEGSRDD